MHIRCGIHFPHFSLDLCCFVSVRLLCDRGVLWGRRPDGSQRAPGTSSRARGRCNSPPPKKGPHLGPQPFGPSLGPPWPFLGGSKRASWGRRRSPVASRSAAAASEPCKFQSRVQFCELNTLATYQAHLCEVNEDEPTCSYCNATLLPIVLMSF